MKSSTRNQFPGIVKAVDLAPVSAQVAVALSSGPEIIATVTRAAAERLSLKAGVPVIV